jgi:hypothetical protein
VQTVQTHQQVRQVPHLHTTGQDHNFFLSALRIRDVYPRSRI